MRLDQAVGLDSETAEGTNSDYSFNDLPVEIIEQIFSYIPGRYWTRLELVNHHFRSGILRTLRNLKNVRLERFFDRQSPSEKAKGAVRRRRILQSLLRTLYVRSPTVESISGFFALVQTLDSGSLQELSQFGTLKSVSIAQCHVHARYLAKFLATSSSRSCLEELRICGSLGFTVTGGISGEQCANDRAMHEAVIDKPGRPPLKLKKLVYRGNGGSWDEFFTGLDVSILETLSFTAFPCSVDCLTKLLGRCTQLQELLWSRSIRHDCYSWTGQRRQRFENATSEMFRGRYTPPTLWLFFQCPPVLAFGSLASANLRKLELHGLPYDCEGTVAEVLKRIAPVCQRLGTLVIRGDWALGGLANGPIGVLSERFPALETLHLNIEYCDDWVIPQLAPRMDRMKRLGLYCPDGTLKPRRQVNSDALQAIASHMRSLESLCLQQLVVSDDSSTVFSELEHLKELNVTGADIPNSAVIGWCKSLGPRLEVLGLSSPTISDSSIAICANELGRVHRLSLRDTRITDLSLRALTKCDRLEMLDLTNCKGITQSGVQAVIDGCNMLVQLELYETPIKKPDLIYQR